MTPRERLEAAGWKARYPEAEARWFSPDISDSATYSQKEALAQLARDGAKETSDDETRDDLRSGNCVGGNSANNGGTAAPIERTPSSPDKLLHYNAVTPNTSQAKEANDGRVDGDAHQVADKADQSSMLAGRDIGNRTASAHNMAPVATSVSAPESAEQFYAKSAFNFVWYRSNGDIFEFAEAYARECASSSSAAPASLSAIELAQKFHEAYERLAPQFGYETRKESAKPWAEVPENNRKLMTTVCREVMRGAADLLDKASAEIHMLERAAESHKYTVSDLRDSRDRLQEALRAAANHLHYVGQEQAAGQARAALGDPPEGNQHG